MATANLSVGINTTPARKALTDLKDEMAKLKVAIPVTIDPKSVTASLSGQKIKVAIDAADLASQFRRAAQEGLKGIKVGSGGVGSAELTQLKAAFGQVQQTVSVLNAEVGKTLASGVTQATTATKQLGKAHQEATGHTKTHAAAMRDAHSAARGLASGFGLIWLTWGNVAPLLAGASLSHGFMQAMKAGTEFAYQLTFVKALGDETAESMNRVAAAAMHMSKDSLYGPVELANGLRTLAQAGLNAEASMAALPTVFDLATVGEMNMKDAAIILAGVMNAFSLRDSDFSRIGDVFAKAAAVSQTSVEQMTQAMRMASVVGEQYGASMEDTATALTLLAKLNITGTAAGTSLRNMLKELYTPTDKAARSLKQLGIEAADANGNLKSFPQIIYEMRDALSKYDKSSQTRFLQDMFGERGAKEAIAMLSKTKEQWKELNDEISVSAGFMSKVAAELETSVKGGFKQAMSTLQTTLVQSFQNSEIAANELSKALKRLFDSEWFTTASSMIVRAVVNVTSVFVGLAPALAAAAAGFVTYKTAVLSLAAIGPIGTIALAVAAGLAAVNAAVTEMGRNRETDNAVKGAYNLANAMERVNEKTWEANRALQEQVKIKRGMLLGGQQTEKDAKYEVDRIDFQIKQLQEKIAPLEARRYQPVFSKNSLSFREAAELTEMERGLRSLKADRKRADQARLTAIGLEDQRREEQRNLNVADALLRNRDEMPTGSKKYESSSAGGASAKELGRYETNRLKNVLRDQAAIEKIYDAHYKRLVATENASAQAGLITREEAENKVTQLTEEQTRVRLQINEGFHNHLKEMLNTSKNMTASQKEQIEGEMERRGLLILELQEELSLKRELAKIASAGAEKRFQDNLDKNNVDLTKELELAKAAAYGKAKNPIERARDNGETLVSNRYAQMIQEAVDARIRAEQSGDEASIKATADRLERLDLEVQAAKKYYGDQYAALAEYQQTGQYGWDKFWEKYQESATTAAMVVEQSMTSVTKNVEDAFADMFQTGTFDYKKMVNSILADAGRLTAKMAVSDLGNLLFGKGKSSGDVLGSIFGGGSGKGVVDIMTNGGWSGLGMGPDAGKGKQEGLLSQATNALKGFWNSLTGATTATTDSTAKTVESVLTMGTKKVAETSATAAMTELAAAAQMAATSLSMIGGTGGGSGAGGVLGSLLNLGSKGGSEFLPFNANAPLPGSFDFVGPMMAAKGYVSAGGIQAFAKGGTFTNRIVSQPTMFRFADGVGMMGEAGAEAIMPLGRDSQGRLGVRYEGREAPHRKVENKVTNNNISVSVNGSGGDPAKIRRSGAAVAREVAGAVAMSGRYR